MLSLLPILPRTVFLGALLVLGLAPTSAHAQNEGEEDRTRVVVAELIAEMVGQNDRLRDFVCTFHRREYVDGRLGPTQEILLKFRRPLDVYMKWTGGEHEGRELIYRKGKNGGKLRINPPGLLPTLNLDPRGRLAMRGSRHSILEVGIPFLVGNIERDTRLKRARPGLETSLAFHGTRTIYGEAAHCYTSVMSKQLEPRFYAAKANICASQRTGLPVRVRLWDHVDGKLVLVEEYGFENLRVNSGLDDLDFDPENPAYDL